MLAQQHQELSEKILATAEALFRRLGFAKTAVADIAAELPRCRKPDRAL
jgi:AcrR family transcriptional regulator